MSDSGASDIPPTCPKCRNDCVSVRYREEDEDRGHGRGDFPAVAREECFDATCQICGYSWVLPVGKGGDGGASYYGASSIDIAERLDIIAGFHGAQKYGWGKHLREGAREIRRLRKMVCSL